MTTPDDAARRRFIGTHATLSPPPMTPEIQLWLAAEATPLWEATESFLEIQMRGTYLFHKTHKWCYWEFFSTQVQMIWDMVSIFSFPLSFYSLHTYSGPFVHLHEGI